MTEMISKWFLASFRTLPFVFLYGDQEPRSWGGGRSNAPPPPPPSRRWKIQRPSRARVKASARAKLSSRLNGKCKILRRFTAQELTHKSAGDKVLSTPSQHYFIYLAEGECLSPIIYVVTWKCSAHEFQLCLSSPFLRWPVWIPLNQLRKESLKKIYIAKGKHIYIISIISILYLCGIADI